MEISMFSNVLFIAIFVIAAFIAAMFLLFKKNKSLGFIVLAAAFILCAAGIVLSNTVFYNNADSVTIKNGSDEDFTIHVNNHLLQYEYTYAQFSSKLSFDALQRELKTKYENAFYDETLNRFVFTDNNEIYTIEYYEHSKFLWADRYKYMFSSNTIGIEENAKSVQVPFPRNAVVEDEIFSSQMKLKCGYDEIKPYYSAFTNVEFENQTIILTYDSYKAILTFEDDTVKIEVE